MQRLTALFFALILIVFTDSAADARVYRIAITDTTTMGADVRVSNGCGYVSRTITGGRGTGIRIEPIVYDETKCNEIEIEFSQMNRRDLCYISVRLDINNRGLPVNNHCSAGPGRIAVSTTASGPGMMEAKVFWQK